MSRSVCDIMTRDVITIKADLSIEAAYALLCSEKVSLLVVQEQGKAVGLISERDVVRILHDHIDISTTRVDCVMNTTVITVQQDIKLFEAYTVMSDQRLRHLVVTDQDGLIAGVATLSDMLDGMGIEYFVDLKQVATIMSKSLTRIRPNDSLRLAIDLMHRQRIGCVLVAENWKPVGMITERDIVKYYKRNTNIDDVCVHEVMQSPVRTMLESTYIPEVNQVMRDEKLRHMVIVDQSGCLTGLISQFDLSTCMEAGYIAYLKGVIEQREEKIKESRHEQDAFLRGNPNAVIAFDMQGVIQELNPAAMQLLGEQQDGLIHKQFEDLLQPSDRENLQQILLQLERNERAHGEMSMQCPSGKCLDVFNSFIPIRKDGEMHCVYVVMHDITEKKQAEYRLIQSEKRFQALLELSHAMPWSLDLISGQFTYVGKQLEQQLGYAIDSWLNMATLASRIFSKDREAALKHCAKSAETGEEAEFVCRMLVQDGSTVAVKMHISVLMDAGCPRELHGFMLNLEPQYMMQVNDKSRLI